MIANDSRLANVEWACLSGFVHPGWTYLYVYGLTTWLWRGVERACALG